MQWQSWLLTTTIAHRKQYVWETVKEWPLFHTTVVFFAFCLMCNLRVLWSQELLTIGTYKGMLVWLEFDQMRQDCSHHSISFGELNWRSQDSIRLETYLSFWIPLPRKCYMLLEFEPVKHKYLKCRTRWDRFFLWHSDSSRCRGIIFIYFVGSFAVPVVADWLILSCVMIGGPCDQYDFFISTYRMHTISMHASRISGGNCRGEQVDASASRLFRLGGVFAVLAVYKRLY